jgi:hypothetical protein
VITLCRPNRLHRLLLELLPGGAKKFLSATQARALLAPIRTDDVVGRTRRRLADDLITELELIDKRTKVADKELRGVGHRQREHPTGVVRDRAHQRTAPTGRCR